jgi:hypothetical protein
MGKALDLFYHNVHYLFPILQKYFLIEFLSKKIPKIKSIKKTLVNLISWFGLTIVTRVVIFTNKSFWLANKKPFD